MRTQSLKDFLDEKADLFNAPEFIPQDPVSIPHRYSRLQDIEVSGFFASLLSWGNRQTILNKTRFLMQLMQDAPYDFILNHRESDRKPFLEFRHRTFNGTDLLYFLEILQIYYSSFLSLETAFVAHLKRKDPDIRNALIGFHDMMFSGPCLVRTKKHLPTPARNSACKRMNMFLRWMVRRDRRGVDFGLWKSISPAQLICPMDTHVARVAFRLKLIPSGQVNWKAAETLTGNLRKFDPQDPVKYDFALFGLGIEEKFH